MAGLHGPERSSVAPGEPAAGGGKGRVELPLEALLVAPYWAGGQLPMTGGLDGAFYRRLADLERPRTSICFFFIVVVVLFQVCLFFLATGYSHLSAFKYLQLCYASELF